MLRERYTTRGSSSSARLNVARGFYVVDRKPKSRRVESNLVRPSTVIFATRCEDRRTGLALVFHRLSRNLGSIGRIVWRGLRYPAFAILPTAISRGSARANSSLGSIGSSALLFLFFFILLRATLYVPLINVRYRLLPPLPKDTRHSSGELR